MKQQYYRTVISYKGSNYFGWQDLGNGGEKPTVQFEILQSLRKICKYAECTISGASRTDAGVHALGQVARFAIPLKIDPGKLQLGMNSLLPDDIRVRECESCLPDFNPNRDCINKTYRYYFSITEIDSPALRDIVAHLPLPESKYPDVQLVLERMSCSCAKFVGEHDFFSFATNDANTKSTVRTLISVKLQKTNISDFGSEVYYFEIKGNGFLRHMVRYIVGTLFEVGKGGIDPADIEEALHNHKQHKLSVKAKSRGLHLQCIEY